MSETYWDEEFDGRGESAGNAVKVLREKAEADSKLIREMSEQLNKLTAESARNKLSEVAKSRELDPSVISLAEKAGYELTEAGLDGFLKDFGGVVAKKASTEVKTETGGDEQSATDLVKSAVAAEEQAELEAMTAASQDTKPAVGLAAVQSTIGSADSPEAVMAALQGLRS